MDKLVLDNREYELKEINFNEFIEWSSIPMDFTHIEIEVREDKGFKYKSIKIDGKYYSFKLIR